MAGRNPWPVKLRDKSLCIDPERNGVHHSSKSAVALELHLIRNSRNNRRYSKTLRVAGEIRVI